jgi:DNA-binding transcriptional regulator LsrR (DeoR family)
MRKLRFSSPEKLLYTVSQLFYEGGYSKSAIAKSYGVSITHVSRLLKEARARRIVEISVRAPRHGDLERNLASQFSLREVRIVSSADSEVVTRRQVGAEAARLFEEVVQPGSVVGLGSGRTIYEMVKAVPERPMAIEVFPLALIADQSFEVRSVDASTLATTLWFKLRPDAKAIRISLHFPGVPFGAVAAAVRASLRPNVRQVFQRCLERNRALFFSAGDLRKESQILDIAEAMNVKLEELQARGVVGDYLFRTVTRIGEAVGTIDDYVLGPDLADLTDLARQPGRHVVLVAGGPTKVPVVLAGLRAHCFNSLVTDDMTATQVLDLARVEPVASGTGGGNVPSRDQV